MSAARSGHAGFTLIEVMVAVAILGLCLVAIFSSQVAAVRVAQRARTTDLATLLARCKMGELEEQLAIDGLPAVDDRVTDECCEDAPIEGYTCETEVVRVVLPDLGATEGDNPAGDPLSALGGGEGEEGEAARPTAEDVLSGGGGDMLGELALGYAFPLLKPSIEEQVRRATVTVKWREGTKERSFDVVRFVVAPPAPSVPTGDQENSP